MYKNKYRGIFEVADYDSKVENEKFKMADSIWQPLLSKFDFYCLNCTGFQERWLRFWGEKGKIQNGGDNMAAIFDWIRRFSFKWHKNECKRIFEVADYDSKVENKKFKMADTIWWKFKNKFNVFHSNCTKMNIRGLLRSLNMMRTSKMKNLEWWIQYGGNLWLNSTFFGLNCTEIAQK